MHREQTGISRPHFSFLRLHSKHESTRRLRLVFDSDMKISSRYSGLKQLVCLKKSKNPTRHFNPSAVAVGDKLSNIAYVRCCLICRTTHITGPPSDQEYASFHN